MDKNGDIICVGDVVKMQAKKHKGWYDNKRAKVVRINSKVVVVQLLEGEMKTYLKKTPFETVDIVEPANPPKKPRVDAPEPEVEGDEPEPLPDDEPICQLFGAQPKQNGKPAPDDATMRLFGDHKLFE